MTVMSFTTPATALFPTAGDLRVGDQVDAVEGVDLDRAFEVVDVACTDAEAVVLLSTPDRSSSRMITVPVGAAISLLPPF